MCGCKHLGAFPSTNGRSYCNDCRVEVAPSGIGGGSWVPHKLSDEYAAKNAREIARSRDPHADCRVATAEKDAEIERLRAKVAGLEKAEQYNIENLERRKAAMKTADRMRGA